MRALVGLTLLAATLIIGILLMRHVDCRKRWEPLPTEYTVGEGCRVVYTTLVLQ